MSEFPSQRHFLTYTGVKLPLNLTSPLEGDAVKNRNTFFVGHYDHQDQLRLVEKMTYGEVEMSHRYDYFATGVLKTATITDAEGEQTTMDFDETGRPA